MYPRSGGISKLPEFDSIISKREMPGKLHLRQKSNANGPGSSVFALRASSVKKNRLI